MSNPGAWAAAGAWIGVHAGVLFMISLALVQAATVLIWRWKRSRPAFSEGQRWATALTVGISSAALFVWLAAQLGDHSGLAAFDLALSRGARHHSGPLLLGFFAAITHAGDTATLTLLAVLVAVALLVWRRPVLAVAFAAALAGNGAITTWLKRDYGRARPLQPPGGEVAHGFGFPSGHSAGSIVAYGLLAYLALRLLPARWHLPLLLAAVALILTVGASRVFIGAHFPSDVLAGFASGAAWLALWVLVLDCVHRQRERDGRR